MLKKIFSKKGSAYLISLGILSVLFISAIFISRLTVFGRWNTIFTSNEKKVEECAESAANLTFKIIKDRMNDSSLFYKSFPFDNNGKQLLDLLTNEYMYFRLPAYVTEANLKMMDTYKQEGIDVQLDMLSDPNTKPYYDQGIVYYYDTVTSNPNTPLAPLENMFKSLGGKVSVQCTGKIKQAFGILPDSADYKVGGIDIPTRKVTGFGSFLYDCLFSDDPEMATGNEPTDNDGGVPVLNLANFVPNEPEFLKAPSLPWDAFYIPYPLPGWPCGFLLDFLIQLIVDCIRNGVIRELGVNNLTPKEFANKIFKGKYDFEIDFANIITKIKETVVKCLPAPLCAFSAKINEESTVEKKGYFEVETIVTYEPHYPNSGEKIVKKLKVQREFMVADIQPVASDYSFFVANSKRLYENPEIENKEKWNGDDQIEWNVGNGELVVHNLPAYDKSTKMVDLSEFKKSIDELSSSSNYEKLLKWLKLPGLVRVNGTKEMQLKLGMLPSKSNYNLRNIKKLELAALITPHKIGSPNCNGHKTTSHDLECQVHTTLFPFCFFDDGKPFDWGYYGGGNPGGGGSYWLATSFPRFARTLFFGDMHIEFPFSLRAEGYLKKVYTHINILFVKILIPPILLFPGIGIVIPWFWAKAKAEPYGFCSFPSYDNDEVGKITWNPNEYHNLPTNLYSTAQYLKKCSYYYNSAEEFYKDIKKRSIKVKNDNVFICDGVTFVNDSIKLPYQSTKMAVMGRGMIVTAGNVTLNGDITRIDDEENNVPSIFSIIARNGAIKSSILAKNIEACLYADKGFFNSYASEVKIFGNLCVNRCNKKNMGGNTDIYYQSNHCRSSLLSMIRPIAKFDPTRYHVTFSSNVAAFKFEKN